jgi:hypothetical protein
MRDKPAPRAQDGFADVRALGAPVQLANVGHQAEVLSAGRRRDGAKPINAAQACEPSLEPNPIPGMESGYPKPARANKVSGLTVQKKEQPAPWWTEEAA